MGAACSAKGRGLRSQLQVQPQPNIREKEDLPLALLPSCSGDEWGSPWLTLWVRQGRKTSTSKPNFLVCKDLAVGSMTKIVYLKSWKENCEVPFACHCQRAVPAEQRPCWEEREPPENSSCSEQEVTHQGLELRCESACCFSGIPFLSSAWGDKDTYTYAWSHRPLLPPHPTPGPGIYILVVLLCNQACASCSSHSTSCPSTGICISIVHLQ